ncbi:hypothetical protein PCANC_18249 [Puccinia coronata f. sp. avenae]|uniref:Uncharacterized protein n=1 Tax=Puccinia coronata f. sp. avenae TaxID=200324 RepID=A0A2N5UQV8_9BASI|nr:hypothetical protein PCANC_26477 [Puccinia coronata f. sp. avenae]PLW18477.1 hypothetical protein PCASD_19528 [Puccinia coronata f. sp. avenae]PLW40151.1 hypothetical protein PCANC_18249 [Puccinia coronata f. sp. avenae]
MFALTVVIITCPIITRERSSVILATFKYPPVLQGSTRPAIALLKSLIRRSRLILVILVILLFFLLTLSYLNVPIGIRLDNYWPNWRTGKNALRTSRDDLPEYCYDPYRLPGHVERSQLPEGPISSVTWIATNPVARGRQGRPTSLDSQAPFVVPTLSAQLLANPDAAELQFLRNRTVLFVGDSLDRNEVYHLAQETFGPQYHRFLMPEDTPEITAPAHPSHRIGLGVHPSLGFTVANWFLMSVDVDEPSTSFFHAGEDPPQLFEGRFHTFYEPLLRQKTSLLKSPPDMVVFNSGLWDLVFLSNRLDFQIAQNRSMGIMSKLQVTGRDLLTQPEIEHHSARFTKFINKLVLYTFNDTMDASSRGRKTRFVYRTMPDSSLSLAKDNAMSRKRVRQIDRLNIQLVLQFNQLQERNVRPKDRVLIDILDWKWIAGQLLDELIDLVHFGRGATQWLYGDMVLHHLRRHIVQQEQGRSYSRFMSSSPHPMSASIVWKDCARFARLRQSSDNPSAPPPISLSRSLFNP